ncbi:MAG: element excision factor XisI family protein [Bacteroidota bacterium]
MDTLKNYQQLLSKFFKERLDIQNSQASGLKGHLTINESKTDFLLLKMGWVNQLFVHAIVFHVEIKNGKVWIYEDKTDIDVPQILVDSGVNKKDIVLGYLSPKLRSFSEYAVA